MPVTSFFVPKEALQGEDVPAHIIWRDLKYETLRIEISGPLRAKEVYNVSRGSWRKEAYGLLIQKPKVEGYVGLIFKSDKLYESTSNATVDFSFLGENQQLVEKRTARVHLFRPDLVVENVPDTITVDLQRNMVQNRIAIKNQGEGTAIVGFRVPRSSNVKLQVPSFVRQFRSKLYSDVERNLSRVEREHPEFSEIIREYTSLVKQALHARRRKGRKFLAELKDVTKRLAENFKHEEFLWAFMEAVGAAYLSNVQLVTAFDSMLEYLNSFASRRVVLIDPLEVLPVSREAKELSIQIVMTDLLVGKYDPIDIPKVKIIGTSEGEVQLYRLFEWK